MQSDLLVDPEDEWLLDLWAWRPRKAGKSSVYYAVAQTTFQMRPFVMYLHHFIIGYPLPGFQPDHINRNGLDNRRANLRIVTVSQNMQNRRGWGKSGYRHICRHNRTRWRVTINRGKNFLYSYHDTLDEAIAARDEMLSKVEAGDAK